MMWYMTAILVWLAMICSVWVYLVVYDLYTDWKNRDR